MELLNPVFPSCGGNVVDSPRDNVVDSPRDFASPVALVETNVAAAPSTGGRCADRQLRHLRQLLLEPLEDSEAARNMQMLVVPYLNRLTLRARHAGPLATQFGFKLGLAIKDCDLSRQPELVSLAGGRWDANNFWRGFAYVLVPELVEYETGTTARKAALNEISRNANLFRMAEALEISPDGLAEVVHLSGGKSAFCQVARAALAAGLNAPSGADLVALSSKTRHRAPQGTAAGSCKAAELYPCEVTIALGEHESEWLDERGVVLEVVLRHEEGTRLLGFIPLPNECASRVAALLAEFEAFLADRSI